MSVSTAGVKPLSQTHKPAKQPKWSEATRYLAAAAHSDNIFRNNVLDNICHPEFRCKAPEFGIDENVIVDQCRTADRRWKIRDVLLLAALLVFLISSRFPSHLGYVLSDHLEDFGLLLQVHASELILLALVAAAILFCHDIIKEHFTLRKSFTKPGAAQFHDGTIAHGSTTPRQNLVVYAGYSPFVGSGLSLRDWSFSVNLHKTVSGGDCDDSDMVSVEDLIQSIKFRLAGLAIPGLEQYHVLFADGRYMREDKRLMPSPYNLPPRCISEAIVSEYSEEQQTCRRSYLCISVTDWSGEMVLTTYLRFKKGESHLFAEASCFILPPLKQSYYELDSMDPSLKLRRVAEMAIASLVKAPFLLLWSPVSVYQIVMKPFHYWSASRQVRKAIRDNPMFNYGALTSVRQLGAENKFRVYFQRLDRDMHQKTIEQCLIDAIVDYLEGHGIDTADIRERRTAILNNGVFISGGVVSAESLVAGTGARSIISKVQSISSAGNKN